MALAAQHLDTPGESAWCPRADQLPHCPPHAFEQCSSQVRSFVEKDISKCQKDTGQIHNFILNTILWQEQEPRPTRWGTLTSKCWVFRSF